MATAAWSNLMAVQQMGFGQPRALGSADERPLSWRVFFLFFLVFFLVNLKGPTFLISFFFFFNMFVNLKGLVMLQKQGLFRMCVFASNEVWFKVETAADQRGKVLLT